MKTTKEILSQQKQAEAKAAEAKAVSDQAAAAAAASKLATREANKAAAESVIKDKRSVDPCSILEFERASCAAHEVIRQQGVDAIRKANEICNRLKEEYIFNQ